MTADTASQFQMVRDCLADYLAAPTGRLSEIEALVLLIDEHLTTTRQEGHPRND